MIEIDELTKRYGAVVAVDSLSFQVRAGCVTGFLGPNGAGKSTTLRMILGLAAPDRGAARINGRPYGRLQYPLREVGALLDANAVDGGRTATGHLAWLARTHGMDRRRVDALLEEVGLQAAAHKRIAAFSLGMKVRLGIAAALLGDPGVLIFDEPLNGLDPEGVRWLRTLCRSLAAEGRTVFLSSHLMSEMEKVADRLVIIGGGRLIIDRSVSELLAQNEGDVRVRSPRAAELAKVLRAAGAVVAPGARGELLVGALPPERVADIAASCGIPVHEITPRTPSLEDIYMRLTSGTLEYRTSRSRSGVGR